jgi:hypothetical protein
MTITRKAIAGSLVAAAAIALTAGAAFAEHHFSGTWKVKDSSGADFEIMLGKDGKASANRGAEGMNGKWVEKDGVAVVTWDTGWMTKIAKKGDHYTKTAFEGDKEKNSSDAVKVK